MPLSSYRNANTWATSSATTTASNEWLLDQRIWCSWTNGTSASTTTSVVVQRGRSYEIYSNAIDTEIWSTWNTAVVHTLKAERAARLMQQQPRVDHEAWVRAEGERAKAREKAEVLLRECLNPAQREELSAKGHFHLDVIAQSGERRRYRIERGRSRNVRQVTPEGRIIKTLCMHPEMNVPDADTMLAQKLYLEGAEDEFLRIANHS